MKRHRLPSLRVPPELQAVADQLRTLGRQFAPVRELMKPVQPQRILEFKAVADIMERRIEAYDRRQFRRCEVEFGDWKGLLLEKANALARRQTKGAPRIEMPPELDPLTQGQCREIARLFDGKWQKFMATGISQWPAPLAHGRPKVQLSAQEAKKFATRKVSLARMSQILAEDDKPKARRLRYAARKSGAHKKVER